MIQWVDVIFDLSVRAQSCNHVALLIICLGVCTCIIIGREFHCLFDICFQISIITPTSPNISDYQFLRKMYS